MKRLVYIYIVCSLFACSNNKEPSNDYALENIPIEFDAKEEAFEYEIIAKQKLQDYFDLIQLKESYPEFSEEISSQLQTVTNDTIYPSRKPDQVLIENLAQLGDQLILSDSEKRVTISFDITSSDQVKKDTIIAIIKTNIVYIDDKEIIATKVLFVEN